MNYLIKLRWLAPRSKKGSYYTLIPIDWDRVHEVKALKINATLTSLNLSYQEDLRGNRIFGDAGAQAIAEAIDQPIFAYIRR